MKMGVPPTAPKALTGLLTPPGMKVCASAKAFFDFSVINFALRYGFLYFVRI